MLLVRRSPGAKSIELVEEDHDCCCAPPRCLLCGMKRMPQPLLRLSDVWAGDKVSSDGVHLRGSV